MNVSTKENFRMEPVLLQDSSRIAEIISNKLILKSSSSEFSEVWFANKMLVYSAVLVVELWVVDELSNQHVTFARKGTLIIILNRTVPFF